MLDRAARARSWALASIIVMLGWGAAVAAPTPVSMPERGHRAGTILVDQSERRLYLVGRRGQALAYTIAVGRDGRRWRGRTRITRKVLNPTFEAPPEVRRDIPSLPALVPPGPRNPLGAAAMTLAGGEYAIHGTNRPRLIGRAVSYGCIRMTNEDVLDLFRRVRVGTRVVVRD